MLAEITQIELSRALLITSSRLQHAFLEIRNKGLVRKEKHHSIAGYLLTGPGQEKYRSILEEVSSRELIPELHKVSVRCKVSYLMETVRNPLDLVYVISCFLKGGEIDIIEKLDQLKALNPGSNDSIRLREMLQDIEEDREGLEKIISDLTLFGSRSDPPENHDEYTTSSIDSMLIMADVKRRKGQVQEAKWYYTSVLEKRDILPSSRWIICIVGLIQCNRMIDGEDKALSYISKMYASIKDPAHISMIRKVEADIYSDKGMYDEAKRMYNSCLTTFRKKKMVLMEISILNNFGVMLFRQEKIDLAERYWIRGRNKAQMNNFIWIKSTIEINLSDIFALKGRIKRAKNMLYDSKHVMEGRGDSEGLSDVHFNLALVSVEEEKPEMALNYFQKAESFPLIYHSKRDERRKVFTKRFKDKGYDPSRVVFK